MKNLKYLERNGVLKSKSYGLGKDILWSLKPHAVLKDLDVKPPTSEIHTFKYEHEKECADVFVSMVLAELVSDWHQHRKLSTGIIPDRTAEIDDFTLHIENERGTQGTAKVIKKLEKYKQYWRETGEQFQVLFLVKDPESFTELFKTVKVPYYSASLEAFIDPLTCPIYSAYGSKTIPSILPNTDT